ncbi:MAG: 3-oxoacyl-[acyl-carrier-protein] reductase [Mycoplasmatales bacterium]
MTKAVFITGGNRGIGLSISKKFASMGYNVAYTYNRNDIDVNIIKQDFDIKVMGYKLDIKDSNECDTVIRKAYEDFDNIDVLVNNAGITKDMLSLKMKTDDFTDVINTNLVGTFNVTQPVIKKMMRQKSGSIINLSSVVGITGNAGQVNYSSSKAALIGMTKSYAKEYGRKNVRVNAVAPGFIATDMTDVLPEELKLKIVENIAMGRLGYPEEVANAVFFLGSEDSSFISGQTIVVDGAMI